MKVIHPKDDNDLYRKARNYKGIHNMKKLYVAVKPSDLIDTYQNAYLFDSEEKALEFTGGKYFGAIWEI